MAIPAQDIIKQAAVDQLQDPDSVHWPVAELCRAFNAGQREIIVYRPDATSAVTTVPLASGAQQALPATACKLLGQVRNTSGKANVRLVDREVMDANFPAWQSDSTSATITNYMYDERDPTVFWVYPPAASASVDMLLSLYPTDISIPADPDATWEAVTGNCSVADEYTTALLDFILYRAFLKDAEYGANSPRTQEHYRRFAEAMGIELQGTVVASPRTKNERGG